MGLDIVRRGVRFASHLYQLAETPREVVSLTLFLLKFGLAHTFTGDRFRGDQVLLLQGSKYVLAPHSTEIFTFDEVYFDHEYDAVAGFTPQDGWVVLDVGANIGVFAREQARRGARVYAFEPNPSCYRRLSRMVRENNLDALLNTFDCAVGSHIGSGTMCVPNNWTTSGSVKVGEAADAKQRVTIDTLDHIVTTLRLRGIDLLKIDTEGAEVDVLSGASQTLGHVDRTIIEYHSSTLLQQVRDVLARSDFTEVLRVETDRDACIGVLYAQRTALVS